MNLRRFAWAVCLLSSMGLGLVGRDPLGLVGGELLAMMTDDSILNVFLDRLTQLCKE